MMIFLYEFDLLLLLPTVPAFTPGGFVVNIFIFFGSARAYHREAQPGTANRLARPEESG
jgi:hypothetical protein